MIELYVALKLASAALTAAAIITGIILGAVGIIREKRDDRNNKK